MTILGSREPAPKFYARYETSKELRRRTGADWVTMPIASRTSLYLIRMVLAAPVFGHGGTGWPT